MTGSWTLNADSFTVAPYWDNLYLTTAEPASAVSAGTAVAGTNHCLMIQYDGHTEPYHWYCWQAKFCF